MWQHESVGISNYEIMRYGLQIRPCGYPARCLHWEKARKDPTMIRRCAWCGCILGETDASQDQTITHGICLRCSEEMLEEAAAYRALEHPADEQPHAILPDASFVLGL